MQNHLPEKQLDKIIEGVASIDQLPRFWELLSIKMEEAQPDLDQYWNLYYLQHMREVFFDACRTIPEYQPFYVSELLRYDGKFFRKHNSDKEINQQLISELENLKKSIAIPAEFAVIINQTIINLSHEKEN